MFHFEKNQITKKPFSLSVLIGSDEIDICNLLDKVVITKSENQAAIAEFSLTKCGDFNFYEWANRRISIYAVFEDEEKILFRGWINTPDIDFNNKTIKYTATNQKVYQIDNLSWDTIKSIGFFSEKLYPDLTTKEEVFNKIMENMPYSYSFDDDGNFYYWGWQAASKQLASVFVNENDILHNYLNFVGLKSASVVNKIELLFQFQYQRKIQRNIQMNYNCGLPTTDFLRWIGKYHFIPAPPVESVVNAVKGAGWRVMSFSYAGLPPPSEGWVPSVYQNYYATTAQWTVAKRWIQNCQQNFNLIIKNDTSIGVFNEKTEKINIPLKLELEDGEEWANEPCFSNTPFEPVGNGDYYYPNTASDYQEYNNAFYFALQTAITALQRSHRSNSISCRIPFNELLKLGQTISFDTEQFNGEAVLSEFSHTFDFGTRLATSTIKGQWVAAFSGNYSDDLSNFWLPTPPAYPVPTPAENISNYGNHITTSRFDDPSDNQSFNFCPQQEEDELYGYVMNEHIPNENATQGIISAVKFAVKTPDIEKESTDAQIADFSETYDFEISGNNPIIRLKCGC